MATFVVVVHPSARTAKIPTTPGKYLTEVRDEACKKFNINPEQFTLKYNNKPISLSQQIRLTNLPQGARLELVQASRSPTVISVALQLPESERNVRLTQKFANNISLWEILRQFESGEGANHNFTQRGVPALADVGASSGAGRLNYEMPVITVMPGHREHGTFVELQQTLSQLGFDNGSALLRLSFRNSGQPLEEAMAEISQYFKTSEAPASATTSASGAHSEALAQVSSIPGPNKAAPEATESTAGVEVPHDAPEPMDMEPSPAPESVPNLPQAEAAAASSDTFTTPPVSQTPPSSDSRLVQIYAAPTSSTPQAARYVFNENDYEPTIEHAKSHQATLQSKTRNQRLLSDKELADQEAERQAKVAVTAEKGAVLRVRFPDQTQVEIKITKADTAEGLYDLIRGYIQYGDQPFQLRYTGPRGQPVPIKRSSEKLLQDLKLSVREILTFVWDDGASNEARLSKPTLKKKYYEKAQALKIEQPTFDNPVGQAAAGSSEEKGKGRLLGSGGSKSSADKESKLKNILNKGLFKR